MTTAVDKTVRLTTSNNKGHIHVLYHDNEDGTYSPDMHASVSVASLSAFDPGENHIGSVGGALKTISAMPLLTVHATYVSGDYVGTSATPMTLTDAARIAAGTGYIRGAVLIDNGANAIAGELWLFDEAVTPPADSAAWSLSDADAVKCIGVIPFATFYASALNTVSQVTGLAIPFKCIAESKDLYACFVTRGTPTLASGDLTFRLSIEQN